MRSHTVLLLLLLLALPKMAPAQIDVSSDGSDGAFSPVSNTVVDLSLAATGVWSDPSPGPGQGIYDPDKWAVVFKYSSVNVPVGVTVSFANHPSGAPVVWLVSGNATIGGTVTLDGQDYGGDDWRDGGPGGFRGGRRIPASDGFGPGGGNSAGSHAYGNATNIPLMGGSGGAGTNFGAGAGGGGAILIAVANTLTVNGLVEANTGGFNTQTKRGSGGAIRFVSDVLTGTGEASALYEGIIRFEATLNTFASTGNPTATLDVASDPAGLWPDASAPRLTPLTLGGQAIPVDPNSSIYFPLTDVSVASSDPQTLVLQGDNVPLASVVTVRIIPRSGAGHSVIASFVSGDETSSTWEAQLTLPDGIMAIQARAELP